MNVPNIILKFNIKSFLLSILEKAKKKPNVSESLKIFQLLEILKVEDINS